MKPRVGLLACDSIWEPLRSAHGDYADMYGALLRAAGADVDLQTFAAHHGELPGRVTDCDAWLISGSRAAVYADRTPWIAELMHFARAAHAAGRPQVGVCFGHQLLAHALGGHTGPARLGWGIGNIDVSLRATPYGPPPQAALKLFMAHQDQVTRLPPGALWLADAAHCPHAAFTLDDRVLGIQPHPEFTASFMRDMTLEETFLLPPAQRAAALASYAEPVDNGIVGPWIADFLRLRSPARSSAWARWQTAGGLF